VTVWASRGIKCASGERPQDVAVSPREIYERIKREEDGEPGKIHSDPKS